MILAFLALAWLLGVAAAAFTKGDAAAALAAAGLLGAIAFAQRPRPSSLLLILAGAGLVFVASWRYSATSPSPDDFGVARLANSEEDVTFRALVSEEPDEAGSSRLYHLEARALLLGQTWEPIAGGVLMRAPLVPAFRYGDILELKGALEIPENSGDFDYREYLLRRGIGATISYPEVRLLESGRGNRLREALFDVRAYLSKGLSRALPEPQSSLAAGVLLGGRSDLPRETRNDMNTTGTSHLVAVSGQNIALLSGVVVAVLAWLIGRRPAAWFALATIAAYAALVGAQPSVIRASMMGGLYLLAILTGRQSRAPIALALAAAIMTALDPQLSHDVSFQLSVAATAGLMTLAPLIEVRLLATTAKRPGLVESPLTRSIAQLAAVTVAAIVFTLPIAAINFERVSLVAPLANLLAAPAFLCVAATALPAAMLGDSLPWASPILGWLAWPLSTYMLETIRLLADMPLSSLQLAGIGTAHAIVYYAGLAALVRILIRRPPSTPDQPTLKSEAMVHPKPLLPASGLALILGLSSLLLWLALSAPSSGQLTVTFLDVGQGDAILIEGPEGHRVLVDGGPNSEALNIALGRRLPFDDRRIDLIVLTHPQLDHMGGLAAVLAEYEVRQIISPAVQVTSKVGEAWEEWTEGTPRVEASRGQSVDLGRGARLLVLAPSAEQLEMGVGDDVNDLSTVLKLEMGRIGIMLTGDIGDQGERYLGFYGSDLEAEVLKVAHHGSKQSTSPEFLKRVSPLVAVVSAGASNPFGHPSQEAMDRLHGSLVLRTDKNGDIKVMTDGQTLWVDRERE